MGLDLFNICRLAPLSIPRRHTPQPPLIAHLYQIRAHVEGRCRERRTVVQPAGWSREAFLELQGDRHALALLMSIVLTCICRYLHTDLDYDHPLYILRVWSSSSSPSSSNRLSSCSSKSNPARVTGSRLQSLCTEGTRTSSSQTPSLAKRRTVTPPSSHIQADRRTMTLGSGFKDV